MIHFTMQTPSIPSIEETQAIVQEVHEDLQQLRPNAILESINHTLMDSRTFGLQLSAALCCHHYHHRQPDCILSAPFFKAHL